jgi:hypothetical protein
MKTKLSCRYFFLLIFSSLTVFCTQQKQEVKKESIFTAEDSLKKNYSDLHKVLYDSLKTEAVKTDSLYQVAKKSPTDRNCSMFLESMPKDFITFSNYYTLFAAADGKLVYNHNVEATHYDFNDPVIAPNEDDYFIIDHVQFIEENPCFSKEQKAWWLIQVSQKGEWGADNLGDLLRFQAQHFNNHVDLYCKILQSKNYSTSFEYFYTLLDNVHIDKNVLSKYHSTKTELSENCSTLIPILDDVFGQLNQKVH